MYIPIAHRTVSPGFQEILLFGTFFGFSLTVFLCLFLCGFVILRLCGLQLFCNIRRCS
jgi:hypothetical protein